MAEDLLQCERVIDEQLKSLQVKRDEDVGQLYLSRSNLKEVSSLARFKNLNKLYLNGNHLWRLNCLTLNYRLEELHLQENQLVSIGGALAHLTCLKVLMLQNNQLTNLELVIKEMKKMQHLQVLNLFNNPVAQEPEYRLFVIRSVPSIELLDRQEILKAELDQAKQIYDQEEQRIKGKIAFGRRSGGPPDLNHGNEARQCCPLEADDKEVGNHFYRDNPPHDNAEDAINARAHKKGLKEFSRFDWSKVPSSTERRTSEKGTLEDPQIVTVRFR